MSVLFEPSVFVNQPFFSSSANYLLYLSSSYFALSSHTFFFFSSSAFHISALFANASLWSILSFSFNDFTVSVLKISQADNGFLGFTTYSETLAADAFFAGFFSTDF